MRHAPFLARTLLVRNNTPEEAMRMVNSIMSKEGFFDQFRRTRYYEKPCQMRSRVNFQRCKAIYNEEMTRKMKFIMRVNREDPYPGCS